MTPPEFGQYFHAVHGYTPFPWQQELLDLVLNRTIENPSADPRDAWPEIIDVPTGLGKTAVLDVAVYLAAAMSSGQSTRSPFRRIFFVVDRRIVVDEAHQPAQRIAKALADPTDPATAAVARALRQQGDDGPVIEVARMRGGVTWDARWVERPDRYAIVTGTVDQIGSRLLFRGYGVSREARPIDAALVGTDSLVIVDEAHLAGPLLETIGALRAMDQGLATSGPTIIRMSATHSSSRHRVHTISQADEAHPVAGPRLRAAKTVHLVEVQATRTATANAVPDALARLALSLADSNRVVGVVANTVARARAVFERIRARLGDQSSVLLTGRSRPVDREHLLQTYYERIRAGRPRAEEPFVLVATQTIEVGADIDLDALITESAPLSALVQRLGRLNRRGSISAAPALVVHDTSAGVDDPVYGPARAATWTWLAQHAAPVTYTHRLDPSTLTGGVDGSPLALRALTANCPPDLLPPAAYTPVLPQSTLDAWARTSPAPHPDPPIEPYLHGITENRPSVHVVWRIGLPKDDAAWAKAKQRREMPEALGRVPTTADEELEVPLVAVRRWLDGALETPVLSDQDAEPPATADDEARRSPAIRYRGPDGRVCVLRVASRDEADVITADQIRPGDLIVVPVEYGGCDRYGWHPSSTEPVIDVADLAGRRARPTLRVGPYLATVIEAYYGTLADASALEKLLHWAKSQADPAIDAADEPISSLLADLGISGSGPLARNLSTIRESRPEDRRRTVWGADKPWCLELTMRGSPFADDRSAGASSIAHERIRLDEHQRAVAARAAQFAGNLGLGRQLCRDLEFAAGLHDEGKRDPRFQAMLWGGDHRLAEVAEHPLAKSGMDPSDRAGRRRAQARAGYPMRMRHEALSAQIAADQVRSLGAADPELVIHLVTAHHGHNRPLLPPVADPEPHVVSVNGHDYSTASTVDWEAPARFARLNQRYGRWGLARLETIVRLADIWCSVRDEAVRERDRVD